MAVDSLVGGSQATLTAPAPPSGKLSSFVGGSSITLTGPTGAVVSSLVGGGRATLAVPPTPYRAVKVKNNGVWERSIISSYDADSGTWR